MTIYRARALGCGLLVILLHPQENRMLPIQKIQQLANKQQVVAESVPSSADPRTRVFSILPHCQK